MASTLYPTIHGFRVNPGVELSDGWNGRQLRDVMYALRANPDDDALLLESCTGREADALLNPGAAMVLEAVTAQYNKLGRTMAALARVLGRHLPESLTLEGEPYIGPDRKNALFAYKVVTFNVSDGQTVSVLFHSPDNDPKKFQPDETLIAYRWMLNKLDITASVAPENGRDITLELMAKRMAQLIEANSAKFQEQNAAREERTAALADAEARREELRARTETAADEITALEDDLQSLASRASKTAERLEAERARNERLKAAKATQPEPATDYAAALMEAFQSQPDLADRLQTFAARSDVEQDGPAMAKTIAENWYDQNAKGIVGQGVPVAQLLTLREGFVTQASEQVMAQMREIAGGETEQPEPSEDDGETAIMRRWIKESDELFEKAQAAGLQPMTREQFMGEINAGKTSGFTLEVLESDMAEAQKMLAEVRAGTRTPRDVVGKGGTKKGAISYLEGRIEKIKIALTDGGFSYPVNVSNYNYYLRKLIREGAAQPSLEADLSAYRDLVKAGDADAAEELATQAPGRHGISYRDFIEKAGVSHETFATTPYADPRTRYAAALAEELAMAGFTPYDFPTGQPEFELGQYTAIAGMQMAAGSGSVYVNEVAASKATVEVSYNPEMQPGLPVQASPRQTFTFDVPVGVLEGKFDDVVGEISGWLAGFGTAFDGVKLPEFGEKLKTDGVNQHDAADIAKRIRQDIKAMLPPGFKPSMFTVRSSKYSMGQSIKIGVKEVPEGFRLFESEATEDQYGDKRYPMTRDALALLKALKAIGNAYRYDNSDSQTDYFDTNFYFDAGYDRDLMDAQRGMAENAKVEPEPVEPEPVEQSGQDGKIQTFEEYVGSAAARQRNYIDQQRAKMNAILDGSDEQKEIPAYQRVTKEMARTRLAELDRMEAEIPARYSVDSEEMRLYYEDKYGITLPRTEPSTPEPSGNTPNPEEQTVTEVEAIAAELQKLADGAVTDTGEFDQMLDELADRAEKAGAMEELDGLLNAAADKLTELLEKEAASVA